MLIERLTLTNLLSFGPDTEPLELRPLNILIGANGSGKSNLLEAIDLLRNAPEQFSKPIRAGGGIRDWQWKGAKDPIVSIEADLRYVTGDDVRTNSACKLRYLLQFGAVKNQPMVVWEEIENGAESRGYRYDRYYLGETELHRRAGAHWREFRKVDDTRSILAERRDPEQYPELTFLGDALPKIRLYRDWAFGRNTAARQPQKADMANDMLEQDCTNLAIVLRHLREDPNAKVRILEALRKLYEGIDDYDSRSIGDDYVQVFFHERGMAIPATRLSDGTLRYLCLLAILCHPNPPPLVCIEEPELGLHPDILPTLATLLREASERCQLIVTTHSDILVDAMTDTPEAIVVCEKHDGATSMKRLSAAELKPWLERYRLGDLWSRGHIGGNRW